MQHDIDPEYPSVVAQFLTADEVADAVSEGLDVYAANCFQNLFTRERSARAASTPQQTAHGVTRRDNGRSRTPANAAA